MKHFEPKDYIALAFLAALVIFKLTGNNGQLDLPVALIVGYYFAKRETIPVVLDPKNALLK